MCIRDRFIIASFIANASKAVYGCQVLISVYLWLSMCSYNTVTHTTFASEWPEIISVPHVMQLGSGIMPGKCVGISNTVSNTVLTGVMTPTLQQSQGCSRVLSWKVSGVR